MWYVNCAIWLVALIHAAIMLAEMFLWRHPIFHSRLGFNQVEADKVAPIVANVGLYNGFLAAGLIWGVVSTGEPQAIMFFLWCVVIAGVYGAVTIKWVTLVLQTAPASVALILLWLAK
jgi:putative membrane protein